MKETARKLVWKLVLVILTAAAVITGVAFWAGRKLSGKDEAC